jgi:type I restriction enzyme, S subunit
MTPEGWQATRLEELLAEPIRNGHSPVCPNTPTGRWTLSLGAVTPGGFNPRALKPAPIADPRLDAATLRRGDIVVSRSNTRERVGLAGLYRGIPPSCAYPDLLMRVRLGPGADPEFVTYCLLSKHGRDFFKRCARGTSGSMPKIDRTILGDFPLPLPPLPEQRKIAAILSSVDEAIEKTQAVIDQVQVIKKGLMQELLTRGLPGRHKKFKKTEIGEIPEEWEVVHLESLCSHVVDCPHETPAYSEHGPFVIRTADIVPGRILLGQARRVAEPTFQSRIRRLEPKEGDVLYSREGEPRWTPKTGH